jgi:Amt family ammonium transporter
MVWYWAGPDAYTSAAAGDAATKTAGWLFQLGAIDFAGGTVVHVNAGIAGLVGALVMGKRLGYGKEAMAPHSLTMTMIGASLLWIGWFGFNVGSNLEANGGAANAFVNTHVATALAAVAWMFGEWIFRGKPTMLGAASGAVAGLVAITPACGYVGLKGALIIGLAAGLVCLWAVVWLKSKLGYDDSLDVFGVHCIGGIIGALLTGVFVNPNLGGVGVYDYVANKPTYDFGAQMSAQLWAVGTSLVWSGVVAFVSYKIVDVVIGLRVTEEQEREGLDETQHGERAYNM